MTNEELKKKIESIIRNAKRDFAYCVPEEWAVKVLADALIAAGIGDLKEHRIFAGKDGSIKQLYSDEEVEDIARQRDEYKHRAEVAEKALKIATELGELCAPVEDYIKQAEKEFAEERKDE